MNMAFWGVEISPEKPTIHSRDNGRRLRITHAILGSKGCPTRTSVQCIVGNGSPILLCALLPNVTESCSLDVEFNEVDDVIFSVVGGSSVHLTGYYKSAVEDIKYIEEKQPQADKDKSEADNKKKETKAELDEKKRDDLSLDNVSGLIQPDVVKPKKKRKSQEDRGAGGLRAHEAAVAEDQEIEALLTDGDEKPKKTTHCVNNEEYIEWDTKWNPSHSVYIEELGKGAPDGKLTTLYNEVSINYSGMLGDVRGEVVETNVGEPPHKIILANKPIIPGLKDGIDGMRVGDKRRITIPPALGFGARRLKKVPPYSWLVYEVELVDAA